MKKKYRFTHKQNTKAKLIWLSVILIFLVTNITFWVDMIDYTRSMEEKLELSISNEYGRFEAENDEVKLYNNMVDCSADFLLSYVSFFIKEQGYTTSLLDKLSERVPVNLYFVTGGGLLGNKGDLNVVKGSASYDCHLSDEEIMTICTSGEYQTVSDEGKVIYYLSQHVGDGYVMIGYQAVDFESLGVTLGSAQAAFPDVELIWIDPSTDLVVASSETEYVGKAITSIVTEEGIADNGKVVYINGTGVCFAKTKAADQYELMAYIPASTWIINAVRNCIVPIILFAVIIITMLTYVLNIRKEVAASDEKHTSGLIHLWGHNYLDFMMFSHIIGLAVFGIFLIVLVVFYSSALINYSSQNQTASENLERVTTNYSENKQNQTAAWNNIRDEYVDHAEDIAWYYMQNPGDLDSDNLNKLKENVEFIKDIMVTDITGTVVASTNYDEGYTIGQGEDSGYSKCWEVLDGNSDNEFYSNDNTKEEDDYMVVVRRQDANGIILVNMTIDYADSFINNWGLEATMLDSDFGDATLLAVKDDNPGLVYICEPGSTEIQHYEAQLDSEMLVNGFMGIRSVGGESYYVNVYDDADDDVVFISGLPIRKISFAVARSTFVLMLLGLCIFVPALLWTTARVVVTTDGDVISTAASDASGAKDETDDEHVTDDAAIEDDINPGGLSDKSIRDNLINSGFKNVLGRLVVTTGILQVLLLSLDYLITTNPLITYLLGTEWNKGVNLFSITMILLIIVGCMLVNKIAGKLIMLIAENMGQRARTIGQLMKSVLSFVLFVVGIILSLMELGCNLSALLTGAGIAGAAISLCASSTINDLLAGFFIVFEGAFQIGDWIRVGDWRGEVIQIGMRTTRVANANCIKIINNSQMTNVTVMDWMNSGALIAIDVAYGEDADYVIQLINDNQERFRREIPKIMDGPYVKGVTDLGTNGLTVELFAFGEDQACVANIERGMRRVCKKLFDENGVEIPFAQVTIHQGDTDSDQDPVQDLKQKSEIIRK